MNRELESVALNFKRLLRQHLNNLPVHKSGIKDSLDVESPSYKTGDKMKIDERLNNMSKEQLISLIKEIKITCESNRRKMGSGNNVFNFILNLIKGIL